LAPDRRQHRVFDGGFIYGNYQGCGWIGTGSESLVASGTYTACGSSASHTLSEYSSQTNHYHCVGGCTDGTPISVVGDCPEYANLRPWSNTSAPTDLLRTRHAGYGSLRWRYQTRYVYGPYFYVMVRDAGISAGAGNWVFVPRPCLGAF
jgi:hypothetical protein